ncbi:MAG: hypothetical protein CL840_18980 [Crocinitomicaceae bacterium]|nr:hypothetical protein [Crocinitomicaceae bacterium]|tara:strand:- start:16974 stop:18860 length:1887 start_codon:yes stop_codon:yes gene_type:complete
MANLKCIVLIVLLIGQFKCLHSQGCDSARVEEAYTEIQSLWLSDLDSALLLTKELLLYAESQNDTAVQLRGLRTLCRCYQRMSGFDSLGLTVSRYLELANSAENLYHRAEALKISGGVYHSTLGQYALAIQELLESIGIYDSIDDSKGKSDALLSLSTNYVFLNDYGLARQVLRESFNTDTYRKDSARSMIPLAKLGDIFLIEKKYDSALVVYQRVLKMAKREGANYFMASMNSAICQILDLKGKQSEAIPYCKQALSCKSVDCIGSETRVITLLTIARVYAHSQKPDSAVYYDLKALEVIKKYDQLKFYSSAYDNLSLHYDQNGDYELSNKYLRLWMNLKDSLATVEKIRELANFEKKYEIQKKEQEIKTLKANAELAKVKEEYRNWLLILAIILLLTIIAIALIRFRLTKSQSEKKQMEVEHRLLRAQINPHFLYNSLGAIQGVIFENDPITAGNYLSSFSTLMRMILENSSLDFTTLVQEIKLVELYLSLQELRFEEKFKYEIDVDGELRTHQIKIPTMIIQPFIENAIEHGLREMKSGGKVHVKVKKADRQLILEIEDNGKGINTAESGNSLRPRGMQLIKDRLAYLKRWQGMDNKLEVINLGWNPEKRSGTLVRLTFYNYVKS